MASDRAVLNELLDLGLRYAPEYRGGLSNHLPMMLVALHELGAGEDRLREAFDRYAPRLGPAPRPATALAHWRDGLGRLEAFAALFEHFATRLDAEGTPALLGDVLPTLMEGVGGAAFHGLIRTAYGVAADHAGETAAGLAYWACRHLPLDAPAATADREPDVQAWLEALARDLTGLEIGGGLIFERMRAVASTAAFARHAGRLGVDERTLAALADLAAQRYAATRHFTVLHLVTSCHALRLLLPWIADRDTALRAYARAYAAGVVASGIALHGEALPCEVADWPPLRQRAVASHDEHVVKLVHSCDAESQLYGDGARRHAAALALSR